MATTLYGVNYTLYNTGVNGPTESNYAARGAAGGKVHVLFDTYEAAATTAGDVVYWGPGKLNAGDIVIGYILSTDDCGTGCTIDIGDASSGGSGRYAADLDNADALSGNMAVLVDGMSYTIGTATDDDIIQLTLADATMTGTIKCAILYIRF